MNIPVRLILEAKGHTVYTTSPHDTARQAAEDMRKFKIGSLLVMHDRRVFGIVTERDLMNSVMANSLDASTTLIGDIMTKNPFVISTTTTVEEAMVIMTEKRCRHLPVMAEGFPVGMLSIGDLTHHLIKDQQTQITDLFRYVTGTHGY